MGLSAAPLTVTVSVADVDAGAPPMGGFYWTLEEDNTQHFVPGIPNDPNGGPREYPQESRALDRYGGWERGTAPPSRSPTRQSTTSFPACPGEVAAPWAMVRRPTPRPNSPMSGARIAPGQLAVTVQVHSTPIPTAQIWILAFEDYAPVNGARTCPPSLACRGSPSSSSIPRAG